VLAANDGASGVAVMLELARQLQQADSLRIGVDFICFDAEDWGTPQWDHNTYANTGEVWALGAEYWSKNTHVENYAPRYGILLDMVGGQGAQFFQERLSKQYAQPIINKVWAAAKVVGFGSYFPDSPGEYITDDHVPVNTHANIPTIDVIPFYPDCQQSGFGPTWHTVNDDMQHIDKNTLKAVGQTLIQVLYSENRTQEKP
jgi:Zn-dependent M28 family amino/carboxypeptidase